MRMLIAVATLFAIVLPATTSAEPAPGELPTGEQLVKDIQGADRIDTFTRQLATIDALNFVILTYEGMIGPDRMSSTGQDRWRSYERIGMQLRDAMIDPRCMTADCPYYVGINQASKLGALESFKLETWRRYLAPEDVEFMASRTLTSRLDQAMATELAQRETNAKRAPLVVLAVAIGSTILFLLAAARRLRGTVDLGKTRPGILVVGTREFSINGATGAVHDPDVSITTRTIVHEDDDGYRRTRHEETRNVEFFLLDQKGQDHHFRVRNVDVGVAPGHQVTAGWVIEKGKERGPYLFFRNHSTRTTSIVPSTAHNMASTPGKPWLLILLSLPAGWIPLVIYGFVSAAVRRGRAAKIIDHIHKTWVPNCDAEAARTPAFVSRAG